MKKVNRPKKTIKTKSSSQMKKRLKITIRKKVQRMNRSKEGGNLGSLTLTTIQGQKDG